MTATQAPDTLRLVPAEPTEAMLKAGAMCEPFQTLEGQKFTPGQIIASSVYRAMIEAAPAVQPAAGREEIEHELIERLLDAQQDINLAANETMRQSLADASQLIDEIEPILRAALSTPDQASEERYKAALEEIVSPVAFMQRRAKADGRQLSGMAYSIANSASYLQGIAKAALYAHPPAQASESGGVDHADIAARLNPDLFSSDERTAHRAASPYAVSIKRAEAVAEVGRVLAAAAALSAPQAAPGD